MHPGFNDSEFANDCFRKLNFRNWMLFFERPDGVGNLLYQIHLLGRKREHIRWSYFFIERCLVHPSLLYVNDVLKFSDALSFRSNIHNYLLRRVLRNFRSWSRQQFSRNLREKRRMSWRTRQRTSLLLQLFWIHQNIFETNTAASEALRLVWNSVPDAHLSSEEINDIFKNILNSNEIVNLYKFYSEAVCEFHAVVEPRSLKHYCRISIRKSLCRNKQWIPEGVQRIGLPWASIHVIKLYQTLLKEKTGFHYHITYFLHPVLKDLENTASSEQRKEIVPPPYHVPSSITNNSSSSERLQKRAFIQISPKPDSISKSRPIAKKKCMKSIHFPDVSSSLKTLPSPSTVETTVVPSRRKKWLAALNWDIPPEKMQSVLKSSRLCDQHFSESSFTSTLKRRLIKFACPFAVEDNHLSSTSDDNLSSHQNLAVSQCASIVTPTVNDVKPSCS
ncbi:hypothetical protein HNY73_017853 [Argiope bruennichi]|uniref:SOCS box domain-containing protein n=1 Tax=Argiope bruennichi TaxID=94029 RepID=A0A8T0EC48_ARGBR|nr:hypothetical protein HNY73_017853 [Argiope bruennichi]